MSIFPTSHLKSSPEKMGDVLRSSLNIPSISAFSDPPSWYSKGELAIPVKFRVATFIETSIKLTIQFNNYLFEFPSFLNKTLFIM